MENVGVLREYLETISLGTVFVRANTHTWRQRTKFGGLVICEHSKIQRTSKREDRDEETGRLRTSSQLRRVRLFENLITEP
jgi:hypothetical protein